jgi:hypothetical protein
MPIEGPLSHVEQEPSDYGSPTQPRYGLPLDGVQRAVASGNSFLSLPEDVGVRDRMAEIETLALFPAQLCETNQQHQRGNGHDQSRDLIVGERFSEEYNTDSGQQQHHGYGIYNANGRQF